MISGHDAQAFLISHFWDAFLGSAYECDSAVVNGVASDEVESALGMYVSLMEASLPLPEGKKIIESFFDKVEKFQSGNPSSNVYGFFEEMMAKYLFDPNSPVRDEDLYLIWVSRLAASPLTEEDMRPAYSHDAAVCSLNKVGSKAADIVFTDRAGRRHSLYGVKADHTLLFFTNPGCPACREIIGQLTSSARISGLVDSGRLAVVNIYIDSEIDTWRSLSSEYPSSWLNGYDQSYTIRTDETYCVRAIPSLYVLDREKTVLLKDAPQEKVLDFLEGL